MTHVISKTILALQYLDYDLDRKAVAHVGNFIEMSRVVTLIGVGKSLAVAQLGASLLQSVGYHATAIHATDMLHGGLGMLSRIQWGTVIFISHSGITQELISVLNAIEEHGRGMTYTVAVTGNHQSELAKRCKIALSYQIDEDGSKHGTIPTVSVAIQLAIINSIVCKAADQLTTETLASFHPSGALHEKYEEKS